MQIKTLNELLDSCSIFKDNSLVGGDCYKQYFPGGKLLLHTILPGATLLLHTIVPGATLLLHTIVPEATLLLHTIVP